MAEPPSARRPLSYRAERRPGAATARQLQGKALSYNNLNDTDAAYELVAEFDKPAAVIVKHGNPCGVPAARILTRPITALAGDRVSAYGGIVAVNRPLDAATAKAMAEHFVEVVIAPAIQPAAADAGGEEEPAACWRRGRCPIPRHRVSACSRSPAASSPRAATTAGVRQADLKVVTKRAPTAAEIADMLFAFAVAKHVEIQRHRLCQGRGDGGYRRRADEPGRFLPHRRLEGERSGRAAAAAESPTKGSVVASDAFFPFADGLLAAVEAARRPSSSRAARCATPR